MATTMTHLERLAANGRLTSHGMYLMGWARTTLRLAHESAAKGPPRGREARQVIDQKITAVLELLYGAMNARLEQAIEPQAINKEAFGLLVHDVTREFFGTVLAEAGRILAGGAEEDKGMMGGDA